MDLASNPSGKPVLIRRLRKRLSRPSSVWLCVALRRISEVPALRLGMARPCELLQFDERDLVDRSNRWRRRPSGRVGGRRSHWRKRRRDDGGWQRSGWRRREPFWRDNQHGRRREPFWRENERRRHRFGRCFRRRSVFVRWGGSELGWQPGRMHRRACRLRPRANGLLPQPHLCDFDEPRLRGLPTSVYEGFRLYERVLHPVPQ
jgi:hypothetical protein